MKSARAATPASDPGPFQFLAGRARVTPDGVLAAIETVGLLAALSVLAWLPARMELALPFVALSMFGFWGIADHARLARDPLRRGAAGVVLAILQRIAAVIGAVAVAALAFLVVGAVIGPIIS